MVPGPIQLRGEKGGMRVSVEKAENEHVCGGASIERGVMSVPQAGSSSLLCHPFCRGQ